LRAILDHIKDVVITSRARCDLRVQPDGRAAVRLFAGGAIGVSIARLLPDWPCRAPPERGLQAFANVGGYEGRNPEPEPRRHAARTARSSRSKSSPAWCASNAGMFRHLPARYQRAARRAGPA
jgi:hypothetical protein